MLFFGLLHENICRGLSRELAFLKVSYPQKSDCHKWLDIVDDLGLVGDLIIQWDPPYASFRCWF